MKCLVHLAGKFPVFLLFLFLETGGPAAAPLPVMPSVSRIEHCAVSVLRSKAVVISWESFLATDCHYEIEQSFNNKNFRTIGLVLDGFDILGTAKKSFKFKDDRIAVLKDKTVVYYRLKKMDCKGKIIYGATMTVRLRPAQ